MTDINKKDATIPIVLGLVGHRTIHPHDIDATKEKLERLLQQFEEAYPHSPLVLMTSLSPGADTLGAEMVLAGSHASRWAVVAPLPTTPDEFLKKNTFETADAEGDRKKFEDLIAHSQVNWFVVPMSESSTAPDDERWHQQLVNASVYVVRHCHTLVALWDKITEPLRPGGTAETVLFQLSGIPPKKYALRDPLGYDGDRGPVICIPIRRPSNESNMNQVDPAKTIAAVDPRTPFSVYVPCYTGIKNETEGTYGLVWGRELLLEKVAVRLTRWNRLVERFLVALGQSRHHTHYHDQQLEYNTSGDHAEVVSRTPDREYAQFLSICQSIEDFNRQSKRISDRNKKYAQRTVVALHVADQLQADQLQADQLLGKTHKEPLQDTLRKLAMVRETAAHLAGRLRLFTNYGRIHIFMALAIAVALLHYYSHPLLVKTHDHGVLIAYVAIWISIFVSVLGFWALRIEENRLDYRALAEALRVREVWALAGSNKSVADAYLGQHRGELLWIRRALQHLSPPPPFWNEQFNAASQSEKVNRLHFIWNTWVKGKESQIAQHYKRVLDMHRSATFWRRLGFSLFITGFFIISLPLTHLVIGNKSSASSADHSEHTEAETSIKNAASFSGNGTSKVFNLVAMELQDRGEPSMADNLSASTAMSPMALGQTYLPDSEPPEAKTLAPAVESYASREADEFPTANHGTSSTNPADASKNSREKPSIAQDHASTESESKKNSAPSHWLNRFIGELDHPHPWILFFGGCLMVLGGISVAVCEKASYESLARHYEQIYMVFRTGAREFAFAISGDLEDRLRNLAFPDHVKTLESVESFSPDIPRALVVIEALGHEALTENVSWLTTHRSKAIEVPFA